MKIVLLEGLGVPEKVIEAQATKLSDMGHTFMAYEKDTDPKVQEARCRDADVIMLANMPLAPSALAGAPELKFMMWPLPVWTYIPMRWPGSGGSR